MALQVKNGGVLAYVGTGLEQAIEEYLKQISEVPEEIQRLITKVSRIIAVMKDAEQRPISSHEVRCWLEEAKQVLLDAEDLLDELATNAAVQKMHADTQSCIGFQIIIRFMLLFPAIPTRTRAMRLWIQGVNDRFDLLTSRTPMFDHQISTVPDSISGLPTWRQTSSLLPDVTSVIGRDGEKEKIIEKLTRFDESSSNNKGFSIVPIVGLGGMGKTTLAQLVFNDEKVKKHFELMMWVYVSNDFDPVRLTKDIIEAAFAFRGMYEQCQITNWDSMQRRLLKEVEGRTFLLVLDDVWEAEQSVWKKLLMPLQFGKKGSKVLVTARNRAFVDKLEGRIEDPTLVEGLSHADIWDLFKKYAFRRNNGADGIVSADYCHLEEIGKSIVQRLKGLPLAARTIGSLLNHDLSVQHWKIVLESELWTLKQGEDDILPALQLSYQYLDADLKQCVAYCSLFPKDRGFSREKLVQLWGAQSFIRKNNRGITMEAVGSKYVDELLHMSFFELGPNVFREDNYVMHDLIHDLAEYVSRDDCFRLEDEELAVIPGTVRHMSVYVSKRGQIDLNKLCSNEKLRTLLFLQKYSCRFFLRTPYLEELFQKLKMLRVLGLSDCGIKMLPTSISDLKHLRYIDLEKNHILRKLPESLGNLYNLQVLILKDCDELCELPSTMSQLVNLRHLVEENYLASRIVGLGRLTALRELRVRGRSLKELEGMSMLRQLRLTNLEEVTSKEDKVQARLQNMGHLQILWLEWTGRWSRSIHLDPIKPELEEDVLQALQPNGSIQELHIDGYGGVKLPDWMEVPSLASFPSLRHVSLLNWPLWQVPPCSFLSQLPHLESLDINRMPEWREWRCPVLCDSLLELAIKNCPKLKELPPLPPTLRSISLYEVSVYRLPELHGCSRVGGGIGTTSSPHLPPVSASLSTLYVSDCNNLRFIGGLLQQHLPNLVEIKIINCQNLMCLPKMGFGHLVSLKRLKITNCPELTFMQPVQEEEDASTQNLPCSLVELEIKECGDAMGGWWWAGLQRLTSISQLSLHGCPTTAELLFDRLERHHHPNLPVTLRELLIDGHNGFDRGQPSTTFSTCTTQLSPPTSPPIPLLDASERALRAFTSLRELTIQHSPNFLQKWGGYCLQPSLERLTVVGGDDLDQECLSACLHDLTSLKRLTLKQLESLHFLSIFRVFPSVGTQNVGNCPLIERLEALRLPTRMKNLILKHLGNVQSLPNLSGLASLETLSIEIYPSIHMLEAMSLPTILKNLTLKDLMNLSSQPNLGDLTSLETLHIECCPGIHMLEATSLPSSLKNLTLMDCKNLHSLPRTLNCLSSLVTMYINRCPSIQSLPDTLNCLSSLETMEIIGCISLQSLPDTLNLFTSLKTMIMHNCPSIQSWPTGGLPSSLETLQVEGCPALTRKHAETAKSFWPKVSYIDKAFIDDDLQGL